MRPISPNWRTGRATAHGRATFGAFLRIAHVSPLQFPTPPVDYGGIEFVLSLLVEELVHRGHDVTLFGTGDSVTSAHLYPIIETNLEAAMIRGTAEKREQYYNSAMATALHHAHQFDVIHSHIQCRRIPFGSLSKTPMLHTLHERLSVDDIWLTQTYPDSALVAVSQNQIADIPAERRTTIPVIYHGCKFRGCLPNRRREDFLLFLGRLGPDKNPVDAIKVALSVGYRIILAGQPSFDDQGEIRYFREEVSPLIDGERVAHVGRVNRQEKLELLDRTLALLFPVQWCEPFGLVMIEAMEAGVPVLAYERGSVPEVVDSGVTGYYGNSVEELAGLIPAAIALDRRRLREHAARRFDYRRMVDEYEILYEREARRR